MNSLFVMYVLGTGFASPPSISSCPSGPVERSAAAEAARLDAERQCAAPVQRVSDFTFTDTCGVWQTLLGVHAEAEFACLASAD